LGSRLYAALRTACTAQCCGLRATLQTDYTTAEQQIVRGLRSGLQRGSRIGAGSGRKRPSLAAKEATKRRTARALFAVFFDLCRKHLEECFGVGVVAFVAGFSPFRAWLRMGCGVDLLQGSDATCV